MKKVNTEILLESLLEDTRKIILEANRWIHIPADVLERKPADGGWSVAQVVEHLNIYCRYYIHAIEKKLHFHDTKPSVFFRPGWLGNYFTNLMAPNANQGITKKMKAPRNAIPSGKPEAILMINEFLSHQQHLINLLQVARSADIGSLRVPTSLSKLIALKLGDTFRFFIAHEQRHLIQVKNLLMATTKKESRLQMQHV